MKKERKKIGQAVAIMFIVGIGLIQNMNHKAHIFNTFNPITFSWEDNSVKTDTLQTNENKLFMYTTKMIRKGIQHIISTL